MRIQSDPYRHTVVSQPSMHLKPILLFILCVILFLCYFVSTWENVLQELPIKDVPLLRTKRTVPAAPELGIKHHHHRSVNNTKSNIYSDSASRKLPSAIIIGVKKGGTRALLTFLRLHPDIRSVGPETHFFDKFYHRGIEWYR